MPRDPRETRQAVYFVAMATMMASVGMSQIRAYANQAPPPLASEPPPLAERLMPVSTRILSCDRVLLAYSAEACEIGLDYSKVPASPAFYSDLAASVGLSAGQLRGSGTGSRYWREPVSVQAAARAAATKRAWKADGVSLRPVTLRRYPLGEAASPVVGSVRDGTPANGLERSLALAEGPAPKEVELTIDSQLQLAATAAIRRAVEDEGAKSGAAVVIDPSSGDVLAMATWPSFDPVAPAGGSDVNAAVMSAFEPGSTFKIVTAALALERGLIRPDTTVQCGGSVTVGKHTLRCSHGAHGKLDVTGVIAESCNVASARWAMELGNADLKSAIERLGLLDRPGLGLPGERAGSIAENETAKRLQAANWGYGQALTCVPVTLAAAYASLANGGVVPTPRLVRAVDGREEPVPPGRRFVSTKVADEVLAMMEAVIESDRGTGKRLRIPGYRLGGKTGTAQKLGREKGKHIANFVGFVPARDPRAVVLVMVDSPSRGRYYGGEVAGPPFREIAQAVIARLRIPPESGKAR